MNQTSVGRNAHISQTRNTEIT